MNAAPPSHLAYSVVGDRYTFLLTGADTGGAHAVFEWGGTDHLACLCRGVWNFGERPRSRQCPLQRRFHIVAAYRFGQMIECAESHRLDGIGAVSECHQDDRSNLPVV
jgi:hypothetical protein